MVALDKVTKVVKHNLPTVVSLKGTDKGHPHKKLESFESLSSISCEDEKQILAPCGPCYPTTPVVVPGHG